MTSVATDRASSVEFDDMQAVLRFGFKHLTQAAFHLLRVKDRDAARAWLATAPITNAVASKPLPPTVLQVGMTSEGLRALGVSPAIIGEFSNEFINGMSSDAGKSKRLGDVAASAPANWTWGTGERMPHVIVMLYAPPEGLDKLERTISAQLQNGFDTTRVLRTATLGQKEPFGFEDGISQPKIDWERTRPVRDQEQFEYTNLSCLGEFVLGYPNEYGLYTERPRLAHTHGAAAALPRCEDAPDMADLGRNGTYLVLRQLEQDVVGLWRYLDRQASGDATRRDRIAAAMVGRTRDGTPLIGKPVGKGGNDPADLNSFTYDDDPHGVQCPRGAHVRRSNPRNADLPRGHSGLISRLSRTLGFDEVARRNDLVASTRFHRLLRRGRAYGDGITPEQALNGATPETERGLHFASVCANIGRQFEFVQSAWIAGTKFDGLIGESDPMVGPREPGLDGCPTNVFSMPQPDGPDERLNDLPTFVTVKGGAYFFLPGLRAMKYLATASADEPSVVPTTGVIDSNASRSIPPADTGSKLLNWISDTSMLMVQAERRIDPFIRPAFDAVLRDPVTRFVQMLINWRRKDEGLKIAEERPLPNEEANLDSIVATFKAQMSGLWKPGAFERGGNTKTQGIVRAELRVHDNLPERYRHGIFVEPRVYPAWVRFSGPGPYVTPDIDDVGFMSISVKLMNVPGPKLMEEERFTQDMFGVSPPTFVTPDTYANAHLQEWSLKNASLFHFLNFKRPHVLDLIMQGLFIKTQSSPFEAPYFSCVPYLLGEGQAMMYSFWPTTTRKTPIPRLPLRPPHDYLRNAMVAALDRGDVDIDVRVQLQTDPHRMPIEHAGVLWPERLSPRVSVATLHIPRQRFNTPNQMAFAKRLSFNPWHCIADHRPLGNQSRARRRMYYELSKFRHEMTGVPHFEPDGSEQFD